MAYCVHCGTELVGAFCAGCGRPATESGQPAVAGRATPATATPTNASPAVPAPTEPALATNGRLCTSCRQWVPGAGRCSTCGDFGIVPHDEAVMMTRAAAQYVHTLDRSARGGAIRSRLNDGEIFGKLAMLALIVVAALVVMGSLASGPRGIVALLLLSFVATVPASIAHSKDRDWFVWFCYGWLLFPLAVGHALMLEHDPDEKPGDRQLRALIGGAAALFISLGVGWAVASI